MEKIKHNRFSKVLVLLMAVMMVLTMMPNGMWGGAETAWAAGGEKAEVYPELLSWRLCDSETKG